MVLKFAIAMLFLTGTHETGYTSHYAPGLMPLQAEYHGLSLPCPECGIAVESCNDIGDYWLIRPLIKKAHPWQLVRVVDCARRDNSDGTRSLMADNSILLELDYDLARRYGADWNSVGIEVIE